MNNETTVLKKYKEWLEKSDAITRKELIKIKNNEEEIFDRFYKELKFETAGIRGIIGNGSNRINKYIVSRAAKGLCNIINNNKEENKNITIAYDSRNYSKEFANVCANVISNEGIKVNIFKEICPVPILSFAIRYFSSNAGIVITASHNPKIYNGFKVYGRDGAQLGPNEALNIQNEILNLDLFENEINENIKMTKKNIINFIDEELYEEYYKKLLEQSINKEVFNIKNTKVVYTPLHGSGNKFIKEILNKLNFSGLNIVKEEEAPNGDFPTVKCPNPEEITSFNMGLKLAKQIKSEIILATDPDCDRVGVMIFSKSKNDFTLLNGNEIGTLLTEYILNQKQKNKTLPGNGFIAKSIVSTNIVKNIAEFYNINVKETLTGFKFIGNLIYESEKNKNETFIFGFEESYGYLAGTHARDKDGVIATMLIIEMFLYYKNIEKIDLKEKLEEIYKKFGYFLENTTSVTLTGVGGSEKIENIMNNLRKFPPKKIAEKNVLAVRDYKTGKRISGTEKNDLLLPSSDVLYYELDEANFIVRPSGTEPKIKFYSLVRAKTKEKCEEIIKKMKEFIKDVIE